MVTSRATGDDLVEDEDAQAVGTTGDITAPPRQSARKPAAAKPAPAKTAPADETQDVPAKNTPVNGATGRDVKANGSPAAKGTARPAPVDDTVIDGIPALPADTIGSARGTRPRDSEPATASFGPPPSAPAKPALEDPTISYAAETAAKLSSETTATSSPGSSSRLASTGSATSGSAAGASASSGTSPATSPAAEAPSMPPAAFAWEMPDPPADSPSSPARAFLRSGLTAKNPPPAPAPTAPASSATRTAPPAAAGQPAGAEAPARGPAKGSPVTLGPPRSGLGKGGPRPKAQKAQSKKSARQAHLTIARVEPWSVMKFSFVVSLVAFVILFVAVSILYGALSGLGVFDSLQRVVTSLTSSQGSTGVNAKAWFSASKVLGYTALLGSLNIVLITAMSTIGSVVYNLTSRLVGGVEVTLRETE
ncbi:MAG TPA: DUF3566 domain-containing protein [Streptosporangiaceae bacterium]|jgi:hypothetical protein